ncbi:DUF1206 domain-containing protein [Dawidia soli]|uniref:DUF1206 domain-containing protein n=1 Tax=Dawidia soli TaxID=2782352 RepID=A0AAP2D6N0_9BACT|nr:DUF1206 domain-containing protein [Dawidia soli]MBT1686102.1 DUF1206 domain-containing protein [Dawidia soli]
MSRRLSSYTRLARYLALGGSIAIGLVYIGIGTIAMLSLLRLKDGGADEDSMLEFLTELPAGWILVSSILIGMLCYIAWRLYEAIANPFHVPRTTRGILTRVGTALSGVAYAIIALSAVQALLGIALEGDGVEEQRLLIEAVLDWRGGVWLIGITGVLVGITGLLEIYHVVRWQYVSRLEMQRLSHMGRRLLHGLAWYGHFSRATILLIMAYFLLQGAIHADPEAVVNTDKAFNFIGESMLGHPLFVIVAIGTIAYGVFMILQGIYLKWEKDR